MAVIKLPKVSFGLVLFAFQILLIALYAKYVDYGEPGASTTKDFYPQFQDVHVMIFIGFGFLMTFLKKYAFGAVSYNMLISAVVIQWAILLNNWLQQRVQKNKGELSGNELEIKLTVKELLFADFTAAAVLITFGAVLGKASRLQLLIMAIFECVFFAISETIIVKYLYISDIGGSILVHLFGAYFGLAVSFFLRNHGDEHENESSVYHSDLFAMIGTLFLWVFWPSFNSGPAGDDPIRQNRAIVNTYLALAACVVTTFVTSSMVDKRFKLNMVHIQNATLAGGVAVGTSADLLIRPWGAILIGMLAGILSVVGYTYITPALCKLCKVHDTCGVNNLHGMPAIFAAICGSVAAASIDKEDYGDASNYEAIYTEGRSKSKQAGFQFAAALVALGVAVFGGLLTGAFISLFDKPDKLYLYDDENEFEVPEQIISVKYSMNGSHQMTSKSQTSQKDEIHENTHA